MRAVNLMPGVVRGRASGAILWPTAQAGDCAAFQPQMQRWSCSAAGERYNASELVLEERGSA
jgi:hypothetical protein